MAGPKPIEGMFNNPMLETLFVEKIHLEISGFLPRMSSAALTLAFTK